MRFVYPYETETAGSALLVYFPDVPEAHTQIESDEDIDELAYDCLVAALGGYVELRREPPRPSPCHGRPAVTLDILTSLKLALANELIGSGI